jgi:hypothetical protein
MKRHAGFITLSASAVLFACLSVQPAEARDCPPHQRLYVLLTVVRLQDPDVESGAEYVKQALNHCTEARHGNASWMKYESSCESYDVRSNYAQVPGVRDLRSAQSRGDRFSFYFLSRSGDSLQQVSYSLTAANRAPRIPSLLGLRRGL